VPAPKVVDIWAYQPDRPKVTMTYRTMTRRRRIATLAVVLTVVAGVARLVDSGDTLAAVRAGTAGFLASGVLALALSVSPRDDWRGLMVGGFFVAAGVASWTCTDRPLVVWALLAAEIVAFGVWAWPWWRHLGSAVRLGTAWLGLAYWLLGVTGAVLMAHWQIAAERLAYAGVFGLVVLAVLRGSRWHDLSAGVAAAFLFAIGGLLLAGSGSLFEDTHIVPDNAWGLGLEYRFWGGPYLFYQPNSMAALAAIAAVRFGLDRNRTVAQRLAVTGLAGFIGYVTHSRTGWVILAVAGIAHALLLWWSRRRRATVPATSSWPIDLPEYGSPTRAAVAAMVPLLVCGAVLAAWTGPAGTSARPGVTQARYSEGGVTSGRWDTWRQVIVEWRRAGGVEKLFGDATTTRAVVKRTGSGESVQLTTDNAVIGALRRGGALGVVGFVVGLGLLVRRAYRRDTPAWFVVAVVASVPPVMTSDALLGGTGGTVWVLLLAGEARLTVGRRVPALSPQPS